MLDGDEQVKRNMERFPESFAFKLTEEEPASWYRILRYLPCRCWEVHCHAFTERGVLMLANVLKSKRAIEVSIKIIDILVRLREAMLANRDVLLTLEQF